MDENLQTHFKNLKSQDNKEQYEAFNEIMAATEREVEWAYEVWDQLKEDLTESDNHGRARAAQFLANLAKSDPENRMLADFPFVWEVTKDEKFVTARHSLKSIWKIALISPEQKEMVLRHLEHRFLNCRNEKNYTLVRFDIIQDLKNIYEVQRDEEVKQLALRLIGTEEDTNYQKKYAKVWK